MKILRKSLAICLFSVFIVSCKAPYKSEDLYGVWLYAKVEYTSRNPIEVMEADQMAQQKPAIVFKAPNQCIILSSGKELAKGTFAVEGNTIRIKETLPDGKSRDIVFTILNLSANDLEFEGTSADVIKVTAKRQ